MNEAVALAFKDHINKFKSLPDSAWDELKKILDFRTYKRDEFIVKENQKYNKEIFVYRGIVRGFYNSPDGTETNVAFYQDEEIICPWFARTRNGSSIVNLQVLVSAVVIEMEQDAFKALRYKYGELLYYGSMVVERELELKTQRELFLLLKSAKERYDLFRKIYPQLENKIQHYHIASYLGVTPVSLSRLRKSLVKRK
jgi:CRP-like cAMP-binding protein